MTYEDITTFLCVAQHSSFTRAAELLYTTQPTITRRIKNLEDELGFPLILRQKGIRNIQLSDEGKSFLIYAEQWKKLYQDTMEIPKKCSYTTFRIAAQTRMIQCIFPDVCRQFIVDFPSLRLDMTNLPSMNSYKRVSRGLLDLAFITVVNYQKNVKTIPAFKEDYIFVCSSDCSYPDAVTPSQLLPEKAVLLSHAPNTDPWFDYWFGQSGHALFLLDDTVLLKSLLESGDYWSVVPASIAHFLTDSPKIAVRELHHAPSPRMTYYLQSPFSNEELCRHFLSLLDRIIRRYPHVHSLLA